MPRESYKSRTLDVRRSARSHLQELRRARLAKKQAIVSGTAEFDEMTHPREVGPQSDVVSSDASEQEYVSAHGDLLDDLASRNATDQSGGEILSSTSAPDDEANDMSGADLPLAEAAMQQIDIAECGNDDGPPCSETTDVTQKLDVKQVDPDWADSPLAGLPGAGPGLVWLLTQCGINTLQELSDQDAVELTAKLGIVGQILDVEQWITLAKEKSKTVEN